MGGVQPALDCLAHVGQQVPAVGDLYCLGCADGGGAGVLCRAVARDHLHPWPLPKPFRHSWGRAVGQQVDHAPALQVHNDRAVCPTLAQRPIVHRHDARRLHLGQWQATDQAQHRIGTRRHGQVLQHLRTCLAAKRRTDPALRLGQPVGSARMGRDQLRQALCKGAPGAFGVAAVEPSDP